MGVEKEADLSFEISVDEKRFRAVGNIAQTAPGCWMGVKAGLLDMNGKGLSGGALQAEYFVFEELD